MFQFKTFRAAAAPWDTLLGRDSPESPFHKNLVNNELRFAFAFCTCQNITSDHVVPSKPASMLASILVQSAGSPLWRNVGEKTGIPTELFSLARATGRSGAWDQGASPSYSLGMRAESNSSDENYERGYSPRQNAVSAAGRGYNGSQGRDFGAGREPEGHEADGSSDDSSSSEDLDSQELENLMKVQCCECKRPLLSNERMRGGKLSGEMDMCSGCHRCYHGSCIRRRQRRHQSLVLSQLKSRGNRSSSSLGSKTRRSQDSDGESEQEEDSWFCCPQCKKLHEDLLSLCDQGEVPLSRGTLAHAYSSDRPLITQDVGAMERRYTLQFLNSSLQTRRQPSSQRSSLGVHDVSASSSQHQGDSGSAKHNEHEGRRGSQRDAQLSGEDDDMDVQEIRAQQQMRALEHVSVVLSDSYGPFVFQQVRGCDFSVLLRNREAAEAASSTLLSQHSALGDTSSSQHLTEEDRELLRNGPMASGAVAAATLDVHGLDLAKIDLLATREDVQGQGHCRALVSGLEDSLTGLGIQSLVVVLDRHDLDARNMWLKHFDGYKCLNKRQANQLGRQFPQFQVYRPQDTVLLRRQLHPRKQQQAQQIVRENTEVSVVREEEGALWKRAGSFTWKALKKVASLGRA
ncbi:hypothetical protein CEUSTIGMA_g11099.t1 [Chlamydomonas eustigma]|uniref:Increased DNA methylation 1 C-terminal domain-containing protein n=1 Tax=Chlamydomonas eustigma TaxID=1157962 RepID=A0A250XKS2_9CHLO|nr:hypothetical protein CEUSTIGMA_g11099.t1 [Chlamydomonas eustigma]|eukprot:GAX83674.1 hypothetical protein CEUSTIGMA_g11099.t1 [Chlamydomonas eustigma]